MHPKNVKILECQSFRVPVTDTIMSSKWNLFIIIILFILLSENIVLNIYPLIMIACSPYLVKLITG